MDRGHIGTAIHAPLSTLKPAGVPQGPLVVVCRRKSRRKSSSTTDFGRAHVPGECPARRHAGLGTGRPARPRRRRARHSPVTAVAAAALGLPIGLMLGALGGGGAIFTVPVLVLLLHQPPPEAMTTSLVVVAVSALMALHQYARQHTVCWTTGLAYTAIGMPLSLLTSHISKQIPEARERR